MYLDSNIFIYAAANKGELGKKCRNLLSDIMHGKRTAITSVVTMNECLYITRKLLNVDTSVNFTTNLLDMPNLNVVPADKDILSLALAIITRYKFLPRDAIHLATALHNHEIILVTEDRDFSKVSEITVKKIRDL